MGDSATRTKQHARPVPFSDHRALARAAPRTHPAVFAQHAQRRESVDHAGGNRVAVRDESHTPEFLSINPNGKIPAIIDPDGPGGEPLALFESGAILLYLADKTGSFIPAEPARRWECIQWVFFQMASIGPMFGQLGYFNKFAGREIADKRPRERYANESKRLLAVLEARLAGGDWIMGDDYGIADIATLGWVNNLITFYEARELVDYDRLVHVPAWLERGMARPAVARGLQIPRRG